MTPRYHWFYKKGIFEGDLLSWNICLQLYLFLIYPLGMRYSSTKIWEIHVKKRDFTRTGIYDDSSISNRLVIASYVNSNEI